MKKSLREIFEVVMFVVCVLVTLWALTHLPPAHATGMTPDNPYCDPGLERVPDFYASNDDALADMKRLAESSAVGDRE